MGPVFIIIIVLGKCLQILRRLYPDTFGYVSTYPEASVFVRSLQIANFYKCNVIYQLI
jgi:hypothetical protein